MFRNLIRENLLNAVIILLFFFLVITGLHYTEEILLPLTFSTLLAMLLLPVVKMMERLRLNRSLAIIASIVGLLIIISVVVYLLSVQVLSFSEDLPELHENATEQIDKIQGFIHEKTGVGPERQLKILNEKAAKLLESSGEYAQAILLGTTGTITSFGVVMIYLFFILYYRNRFNEFILMLTADAHKAKTAHIINQISRVTQKYIIGVFTVMTILAVMNVVGLLIVGLKHAFFFGILVAILNIIPYLGVFIGGSLTVLYAFLSVDSFSMVAATAAVFIIAQFIENNFLTPYITGSQVKINPFAIIVVLLIGGKIWGIPGMILSIPFLGILKIIFDNVDELKPFAYLIGEEETDDDKPSFMSKFKEKIKSFFKKKNS